MENFANGMKQGKKITTMRKSENKAWWIAGEDFGKQVANAFKTEKSINQLYSTQGPEGHLINDAAKIYSESYTKKKLGNSSAPMGLMKFIAIFVKPLEFVTKLMDVMNGNVEVFESQKAWDVLGKPTITMQNFLKCNKND